MRFLKNYNEDDVLTKIFFMYMGFYHGMNGYFLISDNEYIKQGPAVMGIAELLPVQFWGVMLVTSSMFFLAAILQERKSSFIFMMLAGFFGMVTFSLLAMAGIELAIHKVNTLNYIVIASVDCIVLILGGVALWLRKTMFHTRS